MNKHLERWDRRYASSERVWSAGPNETVASEVADLPPGRALDLGCGEGRHAIWLASQGWQVTAIDFSSIGIDRARILAKKSGVEVEWLVADVASYCPPAGGFDLVVISFLHTGAAERSKWLAAAVKALRPGGTLLYVGHDRSKVDHGPGRSENDHGHDGRPKDPATFPAAQDIARSLPGFIIEKSQLVERNLGAETGHREAGAPPAAAFDTLVRARKPETGHSPA